jgi:hypothetical protein
MSLIEENNKINDVLAEYNTLDHLHNETLLKVESSYVYYRIVFIVAIIIIFFVVKEMTTYSLSNYGMKGGGKKITYDLMFNFILMILLLFLAQTFKHSAGYILWCLFVLSYVLVRLKVFPNFK